MLRSKGSFWCLCDAVKGVFSHFSGMHQSGFMELFGTTSFIRGGGFRPKWVLEIGATGNQDYDLWGHLSAGLLNPSMGFGGPDGVARLHLHSHYLKPALQTLQHQGVQGSPPWQPRMWPFQAAVLCALRCWAGGRTRSSSIICGPSAKWKYKAPWATLKNFKMVTTERWSSHKALVRMELRGLHKSHTSAAALGTLNILMKNWRNQWGHNKWVNVYKVLKTIPITK